MKKFKRAVVQGGGLQGARYSDVSEIDLRKSARAYRGDARFRQFCKQWVAIQTVAPENFVGGAKPANTDVDSDKSCGWWTKIKRTTFGGYRQWFLETFRGRFLTCVGCLLLTLVVISRPAFGRLCGRVIGLSIRVIVKRSLGLLLTVLDSILEEAAEQVEQALLPPPGVFIGDRTTDARSPQTTQHSTSLQLMLHLVCLIVGSLLGRVITNAPTAARNPP